MLEMAPWLCSICLVFTALTLKELVRHITIQHASKPNFKVKCGVDGCPETYSKMNSFRKHLHRKHGDKMSIEAEPRFPGNHPEEEQPENTGDSSRDSDLSDQEFDEDDPFVQFNFDEYNQVQPKDLKTCAGQFLLKLQARSKIPKVMVNNIIEGTSMLIGQVNEHLKKRVLDLVDGNNCKDLKAEFFEHVQIVFDEFDNPFEDLNTSYKQSSFLTSNTNFVRPMQYVLASRIGYRNKCSKRQICQQDDTMVYIPLLDSLQQLLSNPNIADMITRQPCKCHDGVLFDICDGQLFKNNPIFQEHPTALQIILYHDEVEIVNPLGTHVGKHKIDLYYYTLGNITPKYRSKLCAIRLLAIVNAHDVSKYGQNRVLAPIINDLHTLANGYIFKVKETAVKLFGAVVSCLGDTEGQHQWGGFKVKVGWALQKCRNCLCTFLNMQQYFRDTYFTERNLEQYHQQCNDIDTAATSETRNNLQTTYGITERSLLTRLPTFDITKQLPQDIMHVLLEGSVQYELRYILEHLIDNGFITLRQLNSRFSQLSLGHQEGNRPPPLRDTVFHGQERYKLKLTAEQARIYLKYLPFCLKGYVDAENQFYQLILQIISIVQICFSPVISTETITELQNAIEEHLQLFKELFPEVNVTPKMHYLLHIPSQILQLGPLLRHCCMRFEARHRYFKDLARQQNFKNICLSLAERCQLDACADSETDNPRQHPLFSSEKEVGPTTAMVNESRTNVLERFQEQLLFANPESLKKIFMIKWVQLFGTKYTTDNCCIIAINATFIEKMPIFGKLCKIWDVDEEIIFEFKSLKTVQFNQDVMAYEVEDPGDDIATEFCFHKYMLDYNVYSLHKQLNSVYITIKYDLRDIIKQHIVGNNPLHF